MSRNNSALTPGRKIHIRLDVAELVDQQRAWSQERQLEQITPQYDGSAYTSSDVRYVDGVGWQLDAIQFDANAVREKDAATESLTTPSGFISEPTFTPGGLLGVYYDPSVVTGDYMYSRALVAGENVTTSGHYNLDADQSSFPNATAGLEDASMLRVGVGTAVGMDELHGAFTAPGSSKDAPKYLFSYYFMGPLGWPANPSYLQSTGYYCASFKGDGRVELRVQLSDQSWALVRTAWYCQPSQVFGCTHRFTITPSNGLYPDHSGGSIQFRFTTGGPEAANTKPGSAHPAMLAAAYDLGDDDGISFKFKYVAPPIVGNPTPLNAPTRIDVRGDYNVKFQSARVGYVTSGQLQDGLIQLPFIPDASEPMFVSCWGDLPAGCNITCQMYEASTDDPPAFSALSGSLGAGFIPVAGQRYYGIVFGFTGPGTDTPTLYGYRIQRQGTTIVVAPGEIEPAFASLDEDGYPTVGKLRTSCASNLVINGAEADPTTNSATFDLWDFTGELDILSDRGELPVIIETEYDATDPTKRCVLFRGYVELPEGQPFFVPEDGLWLPAFKYQCNCVGAWARPAERVLPIRKNFANGPDFNSSGLPYKVTDASVEVWNYLGFDESQLAIPDLPQRLFATPDGQGLMVEPQSSGFEIVQRWAMELGTYYARDENYGTYGAWRMKGALQAPYTFLCSFTPSAPADKLPTAPEAYPSVTIGGQTMPSTFMVRYQSRWTAVRPDGNMVISFGASEGGGDSSAGLLSVVLYNPASFNFFGSAPDPTSVDYLGRPVELYQYLPTYAVSDPQSFDSPMIFASRRVYDVACHGRYRKTFQAPLMIIADPDNPGKVRPLGFYDPVYVDGEPCLLYKGPQIRITKDANQMAHYSVEKLIDGQAAVLGRNTASTSMRSALSKLTMTRFGEVAGTTRQFANEKRAWGITADVLGLPAIRTAPAQNSDGSFTFMLDYDSFG